MASPDIPRYNQQSVELERGSKGTEVRQPQDNTENSTLLESERTNRLEDRMNSLSMEDRMNITTMEERMNSTLASFPIGSTGVTDGTVDCHSSKQVYNKLECH